MTDHAQRDALEIEQIRATIANLNAHTARLLAGIELDETDRRLKGRQAMIEPWKLVVATAAATAAIAVAYANFL